MKIVYQRAIPCGGCGCSYCPDNVFSFSFLLCTPVGKEKLVFMKEGAGFCLDWKQIFITLYIARYGEGSFDLIFIMGGWIALIECVLFW